MAERLVPTASRIGTAIVALRGAVHAPFPPGHAAASKLVTGSARRVALPACHDSEVPSMQTSSVDTRIGPPAWAQPGLAALVALVALTSLAGLVLAADRTSVAPIWFANGILLGVLLRAPARHWAGIIAAGIAGILVARLFVEQSLAMALALALCSALEAFVAAWRIRSHVGDDLDPERLIAFTRIGVLWSVLAPALSGVLAALVFWQVKVATPWEEFATWYTAHVFGMIIVTPLVLVAQRRVAARMLAPGRARATLLSLGLLATVSVAVFLADHAQLLFAIFPPLLYVVFRLGFAGAAIGVVLVSLTGVLATVSGHGPFVLEVLSAQERVLALQFYVAIASLMAFPVSVALADRRTLRRTLQESERRYRTLADHSSDIIVRALLDGTRLYVSPSVSEILGWSPEELLGPARRDLVHPEDRAMFDEELRAMRAGAEKSTLTYRYRHRDGHHIWVESVTRLVTGAHEGQPAEIVRVIRDITRRKRAEHALLDSERALRAVSDSLPALVARVDRDERYTFTNAYFRAVFGVEPASFIGKTMRETLGERLYASFGAHVPRVLAGEAVQFEVERQQQGVPLYFHASYVPDRDASGEVIGFHAMVMDITARKWAELQQAESEARLRTIADNLPVLISFVDANGIVRFCNATYEHWLGKEKEQLVGRSLREALGEATYAAQLEQLRAALGGERVEFELDIAGPDGVRNARAIYVPQRLPDGRVAGVYALTLDMTSIKRVEEELHRLARFDSLTALANRRQFDEYLPQALARAREAGRPVALMFIDVDHFKAINDTLGHAGGDEVLQEFAWRLHAAVDKDDLVARLAGDEFVILLEDVASAADAEGIAASIVAAIREPFELASGNRGVTASIGVAFAPAGQLAAADMMQLADQALYEAKAAGRDTARLAIHT